MEDKIFNVRFAASTTGDCFHTDVRIQNLTNLTNMDMYDRHIANNKMIIWYIAAWPEYGGIDGIYRILDVKKTFLFGNKQHDLECSCESI